MQHLRDLSVPTPMRVVGLPQRFLAQGSRAEVLAEAGLTAQDLAREVTEAMARLDHAFDVL
jgi:1-deoxy-D-xylulose-5-phosphate synthase